jgi:hypothetical protein
MTQEERDRWERWYEEAARRDFERWIYEQCDKEETAATSQEGRNDTSTLG